MKILVDELPSICSECLFLGGILDSGNTYTGCTLLKMKIPFEIGISTKLGNCPLKDYKLNNKTITTIKVGNKIIRKI